MTPGAGTSGQESLSDSAQRAGGPWSSIAPPAVSLPKGGGAIRGIGEKFGANPVTGTGALTVPLAISPGRSGFGPSLSLEYDSGSGNGPFGFGWTMGLPAVTRKTDKGLPQYQVKPDDVFVLSGSEDLVEVHEEIDGVWRPVRAERLVDGREYVIRRYRPRIEGLFARIERWTDIASDETHWRSITRDNVTTLYGKTAESRITDPDDPQRVFSWLICESYDDKGNAVVYGYKAENDDGVDLAAAHERNRTAGSRSTNRLLKRIKYGNRVSRLVEPDLSQADWMFEVVFDYGDHDADAPTPTESGQWSIREDPFSSYRAGFEVRQYRLCERVLMFHHFAQEHDVGSDCLVRSTDLAYSASPVASFVTSVVQSGYRRDNQGGYRKRSLPPLELAYSEAVVDEHVRELDSESLENIPLGVDDAVFGWVDMDGEGLSGILADYAGEWFYKPNVGDGRFGPTQVVSAKPAVASWSGGRQELLDLAGDGQLDLVDFAGRVPGFFERTPDRGWADFRPFDSLPNLDWEDSSLRMVDLSGDGHADILIGDGNVVSWYASLGEEGFETSQSLHQAFDDDYGPQFVGADRGHVSFLADMSGDGLSDLVRVSNGEISYWPNLGYGHFGKRVSMDGAPWLDEPDLFDPRRIRLADVDGSGATDLLYLHRDGMRMYANHSGNGWAPARAMNQAFSALDSVATVTAVDLLGNGTACLVWSSPLPGNTRQPLRFIDLMGGQKPHLLVEVRNNLGAETFIRYAPSTRYYLNDKAAGRPWATRLPFPVHVVDQVETRDLISGNRLVTRYAYHHGFFDGVEREFRGFGLVEQWDTESFKALAASGGTNVEEATAVPPVLTRTWFHTGSPPTDAVSRQLSDEYYREPDLGGAPPNELLLPDTVVPSIMRSVGMAPVGWRLSSSEERQAARSLNGSILHQEIYALDGSPAEMRPYVVTEHNYTIELLQPAIVEHAVFFVHPRETITAHYERALYAAAGGPVADPRVDHQLTLAVDDYGNVTRSASIGYGRRHDDPDTRLTAADRARQRATHLVVTETTYTGSVDLPDDYRTPLPAESFTYEVLGLRPDTQHPGSTNPFGFDELTTKLDAGLAERPYQDWDIDETGLPTPARRLVERTRTLYRRDDLTGPLALGDLQRLGLPFEAYRLAMTEALAVGLYGARIDDTTLGDTARYVHEDGGWWIPSGQISYSLGAGAAADELAEALPHFFLPRRFRDPFGAETERTYDDHDLFSAELRDPLGNRTQAQHDYRVLQPRLLVDANENRTEAAFDTLGMVVATATMGKQSELLGDLLTGFEADLDDLSISAYIADPSTTAGALLGKATTRLVYDLFAFVRTAGDPQPQPSMVASIARETHVSDLPDGQPTRTQHVLAFSDGFGREIQRKVPAEPGPMVERGPDVPRWVGSGWTIFNNKGKPVRQYEPFFSSSPGFEFATVSGVSSVLFYDPVERVVATVHPNHTWEKVAIDTWYQTTWDVNDTALLDPGSDPDVGGYVRAYLTTLGVWESWHTRRAAGQLGEPERAAADKTAAHGGTPSHLWLDSLGRPFLTIEHNRASGVETFPATRTRVDVEGNQREVIDALGRLVMRYDHDMLGTRVRQASMESGERLQLYDVTGRSIFAWNSRGFRTRVEYDALRRPLRSFVQAADLAGELLEHVIEYGEGQPVDQRNLRTQIFRQRDPAGIVTSDSYDFKGNLLTARRQLAADYKTSLDWSGTVDLEDREYTTTTTYDALNRPTTIRTPDGSVARPQYNEANLLERLDATLADGQAVVFVDDVDYNARGQRILCGYGNGSQTRYAYDPRTFRLAALKTQRGNELLQDLTYVFDPAGNITHIADGAQQTTFFRNRLVEPHCAYTYDATYRLIEATGREHLGQVVGGGGGPVSPSPTDAPRVGLLHPGDGNAMGRYVQRYVYDEVGNFLEMTHHGTDPAHPGWTRPYRHKEPSLLEPGRVSNRLTHASASDGTTPQAFGYDAHGNITSMPELPLMRWDHRDQLQASARQAVSNGGTPETTYYVYDAAGQRVRKVSERQAGAGQTPMRMRERVYLGGFEIYRTYAADGATVELERETLHIMDDEERLAVVETRTIGDDGSLPRSIRYQIVDLLSSVSLELDDQAEIISYEEYYPYGSTSYQAVPSQTETPKRYRYTSKERDEESGLNYHIARYYAPWLGRWISCDPLGIRDGLSLYVYVGSKPTSAIDPNGSNEQPGKIKLHDIVSYATRLIDRWSIGENIQKDHPIAKGKLRLINPRINASQHSTIVVETGAARGGRSALPHTVKTFHGRFSDVKEIARLAKLGKWAGFGNEIVEPSLKAMYEAGYRKEVANRATLQQLGELFETDQPNRSPRATPPELDWSKKITPVGPEVSARTGRVKGPNRFAEGTGGGAKMGSYLLDVGSMSGDILRNAGWEDLGLWDALRTKGPGPAALVLASQAFQGAQMTAGAIVSVPERLTSDEYTWHITQTQWWDRKFHSDDVNLLDRVGIEELRSLELIRRGANHGSLRLSPLSRSPGVQF
jgi:RHS repeat-associated protein